MANSTLPECTPTSCAPCNIGASTMCISFPYQFIDQATSTISVVPYVTQYKDGREDSTSFSTITIEEDPECDFFDQHFTWVTAGRTLTWPTTYGLLQDFVGRAESTFEPTKIYSSEGKDCDGTIGTTPLALPSTLDPGFLIIPLGVSSPTLKAGPLPETVIAYLDTFSTVHEQLNSIPITSCAPALPVRTACTTILTSTSTSVSCEEEDVCVTLLETIVETNTHTPFWPTLNGSLTDIKRSAARLTTEIGEATTVLATAESLVLPSSTAEDTDEDSTATHQTDTPSSTEEGLASTSAEEASGSANEANPSSTVAIDPATTDPTSTGIEGFIISGLGSESSSASASTQPTRSGSDATSGSSNGASTSQQGQQSAASVPSSACRRVDSSTQDRAVLLLGAVVLMIIGVY